MADRLESALIVPMPAADAAVGDLRNRLDPSAAAGVPAHVSVHVPWVPKEQVHDADLEALADLAASVAAFDVTFRQIGWFGRDVLWLDPDPVQPFLDLITASAGRWPDRPLYGGEFDDVVPHLTVGMANRGSLDEATASVQAMLPIHDRASQLRWITRDGSDRWLVRLSLDLG